jgi:dihydropteroate synthase
MNLPSGAVLDFSGPALVMGVVNCTDDSFYSGSHNGSTQAAVDRAMAEADAGASIIDFGGESTRPGSDYVNGDEEARRVIPVIEAFRKRYKTAISVDTRKFQVANLALQAGADIINDISALEDEPALGPLCAKANAGIILMHKKGEPRTMQDAPYYDDVVAEVNAYLLEAAERAKRAGIAADKIILDPGPGFGKRTQDNLAIIAHFDRFCSGGYPILAAFSRKTVFGDVLKDAAGNRRPPEGRLAATLTAHTLCVEKGAAIVRVHDVQEAVDMVKTIEAVASHRVF